MEKTGSGFYLIIPILIKTISNTRRMANNNKHSAQVNIGEWLVPDARLWLAKFHHPKPRSHRRSWTRRSTKLFGRQLQQKSNFNNHRIKINRWYPVNCSVPPPDPRPISSPPTPEWYSNKDPIARSLRPLLCKLVVMDMMIVMVMCLLLNSANWYSGIVQQYETRSALC